jgi:hypothetical protein
MTHGKPAESIAFRPGVPQPVWSAAPSLITAACCQVTSEPLRGTRCRQIVPPPGRARPDRGHSDSNPMVSGSPTTANALISNCPQAAGDQGQTTVTAGSASSSGRPAVSASAWSWDRSNVAGADRQGQGGQRHMARQVRCAAPANRDKRRPAEPRQGQRHLGITRHAAGAATNGPAGTHRPDQAPDPCQRQVGHLLIRGPLVAQPQADPGLRQRYGGCTTGTGSGASAPGMGRRWQRVAQAIEQRLELVRRGCPPVASATSQCVSPATITGRPWTTASCPQY